MKSLLTIAKRKWTHLRLQPIRVYCLHHVCAHFDATSMYKEDWMAIEDFKYRISLLQQQGVVFISLSAAYHKLQRDYIRLNKYAVLCFDDGYVSLQEILLWLIQQNIPATLFINPDYAEGKAYRDTPTENYLSIADIENYVTTSYGLIEIGMHGLQHKDVTTMSEKEFIDFVTRSIAATSKIKGFIPFWAYTWGRHTAMTDMILQANNIIPVLTDGMRNFNDTNSIHRELFVVNN